MDRTAAALDWHSLAGGTIGMVVVTSAAPSNYPENPNACVGHSSTTANAVYQSLDPDKFRADQAQGESYLGVPYGQQGRQDNIEGIFEGC